MMDERPGPDLGFYRGVSAALAILVGLGACVWLGMTAARWIG